LYVVATPIGHARDITLRALDVLRRVDVIACEDTRVSAKLLAIHGIKSRLTPYHDHSARGAGPALIERLRGGGTVAYVSDAGTPLISDPGYRLVRACGAEGSPVIPLPGASAVMAALCVSGLPTDRFLFAGFPPPRSAARARFLAELSGVPATLVLMESPRRLAASLAQMAEILGPREAAVGRELTKLFEEVRRGTLADLADHYRAAGAPRGEVTVVVAPPEKAGPADETETDQLLEAELKKLSPRGAAERVAAETGRPFRKLYTRALQLSRGER
jgi:16S rRNA (cytidine1402-2'-O)-methyltransferase